MTINYYLNQKNLRTPLKTILNILMLCCIILSCSKDKRSEKDSNSINKTEDSLRLKLEISNYQDIKLNTQADTLVRNWTMYLDLKNEINRLENYTLQDVISNISTLEKAVDSLQETIPPAVDTFPVTSRINVLHTKAKYMLQLSQKQKPRLNEIKVIAEEYPLEFNALNTQLNEIFIELPEFEN